MSTDPPSEVAMGSPPGCPRHPDRVSYVRCQRCRRPTCPECQVPAAVGIQCVDCVRQHRRTAPRPRTEVGAPVGDGRTPLTLGLLGLLVAVFVAQLATGDRVTTVLGFRPVLSQAEPWRFLTVGLVHSTAFLPHLLLNGLILWAVGREAEQVLGRWRYLGVLTLTTVGGSVGVLWLTPVSQWGGLTVGISGAVFGLFGAALTLEWRRGQAVGRQLVVLLAFALIGVVLPSISWQGHLGGLLTGLLAGGALVVAPRRRRTTWHVVGLAAVAVLLAGLVVVRWSLPDAVLV